MNVLSLFDGISCGQVALEKANVPIQRYYASEIDEDAIKEIQIEEEDDIKTTDKYINEIIVQENDNTDSGAIMILNEDEEYYDMNIGSCRTMKNPKIVSITTIQ